jgi:hypothetical protein
MLADTRGDIKEQDLKNVTACCCFHHYCYFNTPGIKCFHVAFLISAFTECIGVDMLGNLLCLELNCGMPVIGWADLFINMRDPQG